MSACCRAPSTSSTAAYWSSQSMRADVVWSSVASRLAITASKRKSGHSIWTSPSETSPWIPPSIFSPSSHSQCIDPPPYTMARIVIAIHLRSLSTGKPHPLATKSPVLVHNVDVYNTDLSFMIQVHGNRIAGSGGCRKMMRGWTYLLLRIPADWAHRKRNVDFQGGRAGSSRAVGRTPSLLARRLRWFSRA
jgi:hypothetical protein